MVVGCDKKAKRGVAGEAQPFVLVSSIRGMKLVVIRPLSVEYKNGPVF